MRQEYPIPDEIADLFDGYVSKLELRDKYVEKRFGFKKAVKLAKLAEIDRSNFWIAVREIYPEVNNVTTLTFDRTKKAVFIKNEEDKQDDSK